MMRLMKAVSVLAIACLVFCSAAALANDPLDVRIKYEKSRYIIGPNDVLTFQVLNEPEYTQSDILVRPDGFATFMGVGELEAGNKSIEELTQEIERQLSRTLVRPQVMLAVKSTRPGTVYLSGAVMHAGMYQFATRADGNSFPNSDRTERSDMRLTNILANAGGVKMNADL